MKVRKREVCSVVTGSIVSCREFDRRRQPMIVIAIGIAIAIEIWRTKCSIAIPIAIHDAMKGATRPISLVASTRPDRPTLSL